MTLDEAINILKSDNDYNKSIGCDISYEEQIAEWLEELKEYKEHEFDILKKDGQLLYKQGILDSYNKAIDDFCEKLKQDVMATTFGLRICDVNRIAEQLKAGEQNEQR